MNHYVIFFPSLFALIVSKNVCVTDVWVQLGQRGHWNPYFSRPLNDWEVDEVVDLFLRLHGLVVDR